MRHSGRFAAAVALVFVLGLPVQAASFESPDSPFTWVMKAIRRALSGPFPHISPNDDTLSVPKP